MSRRRLSLLAGFALCSLAIPVGAQETLEPQSASPPQSIDILVEPPVEADNNYEDCEEDQDAATITGEIIVCRRRSEDENRLYDKETAERRHAEETAFSADPRTPDFIADCQDQGWPVGCVRMGRVPPPVYFVDFEELPDAPPGSDADRIARGLAPRGNQDGRAGAVQIAGEPQQQRNADELGLPPPPEAAQDASVNPSGSASPEGEPSD